MKKFKTITKRILTLALLFTIILGQIPGGNANGNPNEIEPQDVSPIDKEDIA